MDSQREACVREKGEEAGVSGAGVVVVVVVFLLFFPTLGTRRDPGGYIQINFPSKNKSSKYYLDCADPAFSIGTKEAVQEMSNRVREVVVFCVSQVSSKDVF